MAAPSTRIGSTGPSLTDRLALQAIGVGIPVTAALRRANTDGVLGSITHYTFRLIWHEMLRSRADVALVQSPDDAGDLLSGISWPGGGKGKRRR